MDPDLSECQFGFGQARLNMDVIFRVRGQSQRAIIQDGVAMAINSEIDNAFCSLLLLNIDVNYTEVYNPIGNLF